LNRAAALRASSIGVNPGLTRSAAASLVSIESCCVRVNRRKRGSDRPGPARVFATLFEIVFALLMLVLVVGLGSVALAPNLQRCLVEPLPRP
jgi:hypothetical protein